MIISVSGCSGSGKTTLIDLMRSNIARLAHAKIKQEDNFFFINLFAKLFGRRALTEYNLSRQGGYKHHGSTLFILVDIFYPLVIFAEYLSLYIWYEILFPREILIMDRYAYDYYVTSIHNLKNQHNVFNLILSNFPRPSVAFYISMNADRALKYRENGLINKLNNSKEFLLQEETVYMSITKKHNLIVLEPYLDKRRSMDVVCFYLSLREKFLDVHSISFSGADGTGKSTISQYLRDHLKFVNLKAYTLHFFHDTLANKLIRLIPKFGQTLPQRIGRKIQKKGNIAWAAINYLDALIQINLIKWFHFGDIIIFDRYLFDFLVTFDFYEIPFVNLFEKIIPNVDIHLLFVGSPRLSIIRKPEHTLKNYSKLQTLYLKTANKFKIKVINIVNLSPYQIINKILNT